MKRADALLPLMLAFTCLFTLSACQTVQKPAWDLPAGVKTIPINGYPMAYLEKGEGPTVVLVHGSLNDFRYWDPQLSSLSGNFRLVAVSLRHYYPERWDGKGDNFSIKIHAEDLAIFIERLGAGPVYLVGWSRGGSVAAATAASHPELVRKLVLMEPAIMTLAPTPSGPPKPDPRQARAKATEAYFSKGDIEGGLQYFVDDVNGPGTWKRRTDEQRQFARDNAWTVVGQIADVDTTNCGDLRRMNMPVLLVGGERGPKFLATILAAAETCFPSATRVTIPNAGHPMSRDNPAAFDRAFVDFLSR